MKRKILISLASIIMIIVLVSIGVFAFKPEKPKEDIIPLRSINHDSDLYKTVESKVDQARDSGKVVLMSGTLYEKVNIDLSKNLDGSLFIDLNNSSGDYVCKYLYYIYYFDEMFSKYEMEKDTSTEDVIITYTTECYIALDELYELTLSCDKGLEGYSKSNGYEDDLGTNLKYFCGNVYWSAKEYIENNFPADMLGKFIHENESVYSLLATEAGCTQSSKVKSLANEAKKDMKVLKKAVLENKVTPEEGLKQIDRIWDQYLIESGAKK